MLRNVMENFENVIVLVNSANPMEMGFLNDVNHYLYTDDRYDETHNVAELMGHLKAAVHVGFPGDTGALAIPDILDGTVNPSGHLADTWAVDFMKNPVLNNFGYNRSENGNASGKVHFVHYDEDIFVGYRYYETKYFEEGGKGAENDAGARWYESEVMYPFGYGLSYTEFEWTVTSKDGKADLPKERYGHNDGRSEKRRQDGR